MRKRIIGQTAASGGPLDGWLDLEDLVEVEITSEDPQHPIEGALTQTAGVGWRAAEPGPQTIRLVFPQPQDIRRIQLEFRDIDVDCTQEFVLRWSGASPAPMTEIVRQQWNFSPPGATSQTEDYTVNLQAVATLELSIIPDIGGGTRPATLTQLRLAT